MSFLSDYFEKKEKEKDRDTEFKSLCHFKGMLVILILTTFNIFLKLFSVSSIIWVTLGKKIQTSLTKVSSTIFFLTKSDPPLF